MAAIKETIVKAFLTLLRSSRLPIWGHTQIVLAKMLTILGMFIVGRYSVTEQRWEQVGGKVTWLLLISVLVLLTIWFVGAAANYFQYRQHPKYVKSIYFLKTLDRYMWKVFIFSVIGLAALGVIFGAGT